MPASDRESSTDRAFERALLGSARSDQPAANAKDAAWRRFGVALLGTAALGAGAKAFRATTIGARGARAGVALKWLLLGAIGGSSMTALLMGVAHAPENRQPTAAQVVQTPALEPRPTASIGVGETSRAFEPSHATKPETTTMRRPRDAKREARAASSSSGRSASSWSAAASQRLEGDRAGASTLSEEVSLLDAARTASSVGAFDDALRLIDAYRDRFPAGALAADAEVVAIEALFAKKDDARASALGSRFLANHPGDPHAARVRSLVERSGFGAASR